MKYKFYKKIINCKYKTLQPQIVMITCVQLRDAIQKVND